MAHMVEVGFIAADQAAKHRVDLAAFEHQRCDQRVAASHRRFGGFGRDAFASHQLVVQLPVAAESRVVLRVADLEVDACRQPQPGTLDAHRDHGRSADQHRSGQPLFEHDLHRAQHTLVFTFGIDHARSVPGAGNAGCSKHRLHHHAGLVDEAGELLPIRF